jgi:hypothetical protein
MCGDRGQCHVGAAEQFGLDGGDPVGSEATHQLLGMHRTGLGRRQRHQWFVGAVFGGLARGLDHVAAVVGVDQAVPPYRCGSLQGSPSFMLLNRWSSSWNVPMPPCLMRSAKARLWSA